MRGQLAGELLLQCPMEYELRKFISQLLQWQAIPVRRAGADLDSHGHDLLDGRGEQLPPVFVARRSVTLRKFAEPLDRQDLGHSLSVGVSRQQKSLPRKRKPVRFHGIQHAMKTRRAFLLLALLLTPALHAERATALFAGGCFWCMEP